MSARLVLDVSVALTWCFEDEMTSERIDFLDLLKDASIVVPPLWHVELANALIQGHRRGRIDQAAIGEFDALIRQLDFRTDHGRDRDGLLALIDLARLHGLTAYGAVYLELALRLTVPLATHDLALERVARLAGVEVIGG